MKILLLEDDKNLHESLKAYLEMEAFSISSAFSANEAYELAYDTPFDLYIFDVNIGLDNGFDVLDNLRQAGDQTPTIYITALTDIASMTKGFNVGADDYIKKPFDPEELVLRIKSRYMVDNLLHYNELSYDPISKELKQNGEIVHLSSVLANLFHLFILHKNRVVPTDLLLDELKSPNSNALRVSLSKLKSKLNLKIKNIKSVGYLLEEV